MGFLKYLNPKNWALFEEEADGLFFMRIWIYVLWLAVCCGVAGVVASKSLSGGIFLFLAVLVGGTLIALLVFFGMKITSGAAGSLYTGVHKKDDKAILKGMYKQAHGLRLTNQQSMAAKIYRDLLTAYPEELDARLLLGQLLYQELDDSKGALKEFRLLQRTIKEKNVQYKYQETVDEILREIREEIREEKEETIERNDKK